mmetsp:Transcript_5146/g.14434  ORF Transcript_5146/g.14434 Transcript_5146/m.14434 type:complete len:234 (-) Transcript_5146:282-983(-)
MRRCPRPRATTQRRPLPPTISRHPRSRRGPGRLRPPRRTRSVGSAGRRRAIRARGIAGAQSGAGPARAATQVRDCPKSSGRCPGCSNTPGRPLCGKVRSNPRAARTRPAAPARGDPRSPAHGAARRAAGPRTGRPSPKLRVRRTPCRTGGPNCSSGPRGCSRTRAQRRPQPRSNSRVAALEKPPSRANGGPNALTSPSRCSAHSGGAPPRRSLGSRARPRRGGRCWGRWRQKR